ncbi:protein unc-80 homolog isoform X4 [Neopsephotus bourkii]|uniref:protein unc-80 homolog isoform X4 n=1 Tax=Neopsephotus bourkii TaxID=309878 RepID=UPI002AA52585|nr:protein unc-80 homolog isoform X4 [Neopsephotus bourkii]
MVKRKSSEGQEQESGRGIPLPIQTFLWRQTSAFLRPKLGKQYEASCVSFERVLVENKLHGLSPALSEAIQSISRWELVQAALPHVLHCTATLLSNRNKLGHQDKLGVAETKLLHTLHWMLLEAPQDCSNDRFGSDRGSSWGGSSSAFIHQAENQGSPGHHRPSTTNDEEENNRRKFFQNSMATVELFVFLFAPLVHRIKESDLTFRLASGLVIWQPMWEHRQPEVSAFNALVKPIRNIVTAKRSSPTNNQSVTCESPNLDSGHTEGLQVVCETTQPDSVPPKATFSACHRGNSLDGSVSSQTSQERGTAHPRVSLVIPPCQKSRYATYFDVAVLRCLLQPHWSEEGTQWSLMYYLQRLRHMLQEKPEKPPEPEVTPLPRPRSSSMVAAAPSLVNTHKTQDLTMKCNEEEKSLSTEAFSKVSMTNLRRPAVPDLSTDLGMNIFKKFKSRKEDRERERKGSIPFHHTGKKRQRRMGVPFLLHEDHLDVSPTRSTFSFGSFSGIGEDRRGIERGGWQTTILGKFTRRGSSDTATEMESLSARHSHSHHTLVSDLPDHSNSHGENTVKEVRSQISTITVATFNTTLASFNVGYADFFSEHMRKLCNQVPIPEMPHEPLACANLPRSLTDSCINYSCLEDTDHIDGTNNFVHKNGMLDLSVVLKAVYLVLNHDISSRVCDVALNIVECLLQLGVVPCVEKVRRKSENKENEAPEKRPSEGSFQLKGAASGGSACGFGAPPVSGDGDGGDGSGGGGGGGSDGGGGGGPYEKNDKNQEKDEGPSVSTHRLALTMLIKIVKSLGCAYGCGEGHRGLSGDRLRHQAQNCLTKLYKLDKMQFRQTMRDYVNRDSLNNVVDFLHALLGFCMEPVTDNKAGFGNNFTTVDNKSTAQSVEGIIVSAMFKSLITRCASTTHELHSPENLGLYCDIRQLVQFIKEAHGNVFRRVALSALLDSAEKLTPGKKTEETEQEPKPSGSKRSEVGSVIIDKGQASAAPDECRSYISSRPMQTPEHDEQIQGAVLGRKDFWRKMFKSQSAASDTSSQSEQDTSECTTAHSGTTTDRRSRSRSRRISLRKKLKLPIGKWNWLKRSSLSGLADGVEDLLDISSVDRLSFIRQSSKVKFTSAVKLSEGGGQGGGLDNGREEEENFFKRLGKWRTCRRHPSKLHHTEEKDGCHSFDDHLTSNQEGGKSKNVVNLGAIRQGMKRFQFLLNCCEPGTIPDASILAAALDLEAPVVARAALFLECARFVHRCNRGNWPEWMKGHHVNITKKGLSRGRSPVVGNKRNQKLQWNAAKLFYQWGDAIGVRLNELCHAESESPANLLGLIYDEETKRRLRKEDEEEDFLDDSKETPFTTRTPPCTVNPTKCCCPFALKMAACQLLLEITTFLRETFPYMPRPRTEPLVDLESCRLRLDPEMDRHRYERKISFAGVLDENEDAKDSLHSSSHTLKSEAGFEEKKVPIRKIRIGGSRLLQIKGTRSFRVKKGGSLSSIRRAGSLKSTKLSRQDSESENEELQLSHSRDTVTDIEGSPWSASEPSIEPEVLSNTGAEENYHRNMSWLHVMILLCNQQSFICTHIDYCHPHCYLHHSRSCARLVRAIKLLYGDTVDSLRENSTLNTVARGKKQKECSDKSCLRTPSLKKRVIDINLEGKKDSGMLKYIRHQVMSLSPAPLSLLIKAAPILTEEMYGDIQPAAWELLLSVDEHMAGAAAAMFLLCAVKVPEAVSDMLMSEFHHPETVQRLNAILKFHTLWRFRYQVWPRMEEGAQQIFKIPPPSINFTLPSPVLGMPSVPMFDPPWVPQCSGSVQDPINEDQSKSFSARAVSRSHQRAEHILKNLQQEEEKKRLGREASLITAIPITQEACYEPTCTPSSEQEEEVEEVANLASRRLSVSPSCTSSTSHRNYSFRRGSVWSVRSAVSAEDEEHTTEHTPNHHVPQPPQAVFPACICAAVLPIVHLMEDGEVREDGVAVSAVAQQVLWNCLIEDPSTVLRHFLEKLTISNRQDELMYMLRKLLLNIGDFPAQTSHILFNYLVGLIMYFVRTPCEWGMDAISATLTFLWEVVGYVEGLFFKDLKQTMKKEQCEVKLLVTASMPGTKTLVVHGQNECDIPTQLPVHEDTQFEALLKECLEFFNIPETQSSHYFLMDKRWNLIHYNKTYVRDIYPFRRSVSPQLNLVQMHPEKGQELIQKQVFTRKLEEVGRVLFLISLTQKIPTAHKQSHVSMLQEDLLRLPSFPRSAIDAEFSLFSDPQAGKELFGLDTLQKSLWIKLLEEMFLGMPSEFPWGDEIMLFLNVFNGALILHPEDSALLRQYAATVINTAVHFNHLFSLSGYQWVLPSMLQVYADYESNPQLRQAIEFACRQFYVLHRKPFILQLFASVAPLLEFPDATNNGTGKGVSAQCLFDLLQSLEGDTPDILDILELVKAEKPLRSLDFCYGNEDLTFSISEAIKLCVTVVAYAPESFRSLQMLMVLEALVPCYLQKLKRQTSQAETVTASREEIAAMAALATSLQALLYSVEVLTRPMTAPQMSRCDQGHKGTTTANHTMSAGVNTRYPEQGAKLHFIRENLHLLEEGQGLPREELDERIAREEFRRPRESLLNICTEFYKHCGPRLKILQNLAGEPRVTSLELLDVKSHMRLAEIAHSLLKLAPYDTQTMESRGLRRYIMEMLPITDWTAEAVRPALILILKRLDRMFNKIHKMPTLRRQVEWEPASSLIEGVCLTLQRQPIISFLPHLRSLINVCVNLVMGVVGPSSVADGLPLLHLSPYLSPPLPFSTAVVRLVALQIQALKEDFPLSHVVSPFTNQERREGMLLNLLIPFVLTVGSGSKDSPWLEQPEVLLLLQTVINILLPPRIISTSRSKNFMLESSPAHCSTPGDAGKDLRREGLADSTSQAAYLALKVILVCFERQLDSQWYWLSLQVKEMALRKVGGLALWDFLDFIVRTRIPIFVLLRPFIQCKLLAQPAENHEELTARQHIADQLERRFIPRPLCKSSLIAEFNNELKILKEAVHSGSAYQGKTSVSTVGTSTSAYRLSLATMSRSNTGTGTVWEQDSEPSQQASQDTLSRTDEEDEENDSLSMPSVVSEQEAYLMGAIGRRRFSSHLSSVSAPQAEVGMLPSQSEPNVLDDSPSLATEGSLSRVASVQSEPGQQNLLLQQPLGRKRGLRQLRRPLLSRQKTQTEPRSRHGARLSTTRRSIQPKPKPSAEQKRSVTFTEVQPEAPAASPGTTPAPAAQQPGCSHSSPQEPSKQDPPGQPVLTSSPAIVVADLHSQSTGQSEALPAEKEKEKEEGLESRPTTAQSTPPTQLSDSEDYAGLETTSLLHHGDTVLHISEDNGMENPLLATHFSFTNVELGETDVDLDESHV